MKKGGPQSLSAAQMHSKKEPSWCEMRLPQCRGGFHFGRQSLFEAPLEV